MKYTTTYLRSHYITATTATSVNVKTPSVDVERRTVGGGGGAVKPPHRLQPDDSTDYADVFLKCKSRPPHEDLPDNTNDTYFATEPLSRVFGSLNEHEFSSNIWFKDPRLPAAVRLEEDGRNAIQSITRQSYEETCTLFYDSKTLSTRYFENCSEFKTKVIVRVDCDDKEDCASTSVKLRVCRSKFNWNDKTTLTLSRAIELPMLGWNVDDINSPNGRTAPRVRATKSRKIIFWGVTLTHGSRTYLFRIAFRHNADPRKHVECNIECEDPICGRLFGEMFYALYKYYMHQYQTQERAIEPVIGNYTLFQQSLHYTVDLTAEQRDMIDTLRLVVWPEWGEPEACAAGVAESVAEFVTYMGIHVYVSFSCRQTEEESGAGVEYLKRFERITIYETNDGLRSADVSVPVDDEAVPSSDRTSVGRLEAPANDAQ